MTTQANFKDEWLNKAFQLAFFIHGNRETAKRIAAGAMNKLEVASNAQFKRYYYTPTGRAETSRATRSRVSLNDLQLLQRLVFVESENFERENEQSKTTSEKNLLIHFIKHLVRISLKRNSFYVTLAVSRILHNYGTADAMEIYNIVVQDPERVHDDYYYRSRKGVLMKELKSRFDGFLEIVKGNRGEERFNYQTNAENLTEIARECLKFFMPWNSNCVIPEKFNPFTDIIKPFYFDKNDPDEEHLTEVNRIHAALHPVCFSRLTEALKLPLPIEKMEIPKFMLKDNSTNFNDHDWRNPPDLGADELEQIKGVLAAQAESRKAMSANVLRVVSDGAETARINLDETDAVKFDLNEGAELIEVRVVEKNGETVLATHLLSFDELEKGIRSQTVLLEGGQKVSFDFSPTFDEYGEIVSLNCAVKYAETAWQRRAALALRRARFALAGQNWILKPALTFGLLLLALTFGWLILQKIGKDDDFVKKPIPQNQNIEIKLPVNSPPGEKQEIANKNDLPKNLEKPKQFEEREPKKVLANNKKPENVEKTNPQKKNELEVPQNQLANNNRQIKKESTDENGVLRMPIREGNQKFPDERNSVRGNTNQRNSLKNRGKSLSEIKQIYIEVSGDKFLGKQIREQISAELGKITNFVIVDDKEQADAVLKVYVRHESDGDEPEDRSVALIVRLVNAEGFVVYPNLKRISGWKYVGVISKLPPRIAADLAKTISSKK
jgi:hypothetical protein